MDTVLVIANRGVPPDFLQEFQSRLQAELPHHNVVVRSWGGFRRRLFDIVPLWSAPDAILHVRGLAEEHIRVRGSDVIAIEPEISTSEGVFRWEILRAVDQESLGEIVRRIARSFGRWLAEVWERLLVRWWLLLGRTPVLSSINAAFSTGGTASLRLDAVIEDLKERAETARIVSAQMGKPGWLRRWVYPGSFSWRVTAWHAEQRNAEFKKLFYTALLEITKEHKIRQLHYKIIAFFLIPVIGALLNVALFDMSLASLAVAGAVLAAILSIYSFLWKGDQSSVFTEFSKPAVFDDDFSELEVFDTEFREVGSAEGDGNEIDIVKITAEDEIREAYNKVVKAYHPGAPKSDAWLASLSPRLERLNNRWRLAILIPVILAPVIGFISGHLSFDLLVASILAAGVINLLRAVGREV